jgi:pimeloyl-ACP methyl ester carboxylesterase
VTGKRGAGTRAVMALVLVVAMTAAHAQQGPWIRHDASNHGVIVFVHGILGDERTTWTNGSSYWPEMLMHDHTFDGQDIYLYHYPSPRLGQAFTIDEVAENMRSVLTTDGVLQHTEITFVSHSMGGIVTRALILKYRK